jgi:DNA-damage-inducible protein D
MYINPIVFNESMENTAKNGALVAFQDKKIRRIWYNDKWYFSVVDIVYVLTDSTDAKDYWYRLKVREKETSGIELSTFCRQLKLPSTDGKYYATDCASTESIFRIIQSIPSPKAEPFKIWLAKVGYERIQEIENPELSQKRMKDLFRQKGYSDDWIEKRVRGVIIRDELTDEWKKRGIKSDRDFSILTAEISKATFGMTPSEYMDFKGLKKENLRDHMNDLELIFTMLGERVTTEITQVKNAQGSPECEHAAKEGGEVAGNARKDAENRIGKPISSKENYLNMTEKKKRKLMN